MSAPLPLPLGRVVWTPGALDTFTPDILGSCLARHQSGDWGDVSEDDRKANDEAARSGGGFMSSYDIRGDKLWVITEADRSSTCLLLPSDY